MSLDTPVRLDRKETALELNRMAGRHERNTVQNRPGRAPTIAPDDNRAAKVLRHAARLLTERN